ncbi:MAG: DNA-binding protein [Peptococcaceae bacterium]|jgi:predicted DNA-binding protein with PD1-like motif|nr:DNA-binding protein [Peptococcaceae bacterium]
MHYTQAQLGRIFILSLEHGDRIPEVIENFAQEQKIQAALVHFVGGADSDSRLVVGPEERSLSHIQPMVIPLLGVSESFGVGMLFIDEEQGVPKLHMHAAFGREHRSVTGCTREGVNVWLMGEAVIYELLNSSARRMKDPASGFSTLAF